MTASWRRTGVIVGRESWVVGQVRNDLGLARRNASSQERRLVGRDRPRLKGRPPGARRHRFWVSSEESGPLFVFDIRLASEALVSLEPASALAATPAEQPAGEHTEGRRTEECTERPKLHKPCPVRTDLESAHRRHPYATSAAGALGLRMVTVASRGGVGLSGSLSAGPTASACTKSIGNLSHWNHGRVPVLHRLSVNVLDAQAPLE